MAVTTTPRLSLTRWSASTDALTRAQMDTTHANLELWAGRFEEGAGLNARPSFGIRDRYWSDTTTGAIWRDTGTAWVCVGNYMHGSAAVVALTGQDTTVTTGTPIFRVADHSYGDVFKVYNNRVVMDAVTGDPQPLATGDESFTVWGSDQARVALGASSAWAGGSATVPIITMRSRPSAINSEDEDDDREAVRLYADYSDLRIDSPAVNNPVFGEEDWTPTAYFGAASIVGRPNLHLYDKGSPLLTGGPGNVDNTVQLDVDGTLRLKGGVRVGFSDADGLVDAATVARIGSDGKVYAAGVPGAVDVGAALTTLDTRVDDLEGDMPAQPVGAPLITAATGWTLLTSHFRKVALGSASISMVQVVGTLERTGATVTPSAAGNMTDTAVCTFPSGYRPLTSTTLPLQVVSQAPAMGKVETTGIVTLMEMAPGGAVATGAELRFAAFFLAA